MIKIGSGGVYENCGHITLPDADWYDIECVQPLTGDTIVVEATFKDQRLRIPEIRAYYKPYDKFRRHQVGECARGSEGVTGGSSDVTTISGVTG